MKLTNEILPVQPERKRTAKNRILLPLLCFGLFWAVVFGTAGTYAYLSDRDTPKENVFTVGDVVITVDEVFEQPDDLIVGVNTYKKDVTFTNEGTVPSFVRANLLFSIGDIEDISEISSDGGQTWYSLDEFPDHLPSGWAYQPDGDLGGYYYYAEAIEPGESTTSLITNVRTTFQEKVSDTDMSINYTSRNYDIFVYAEGMQQMKLDGSGLWTDYEQAWSTFLAQKG